MRINNQKRILEFWVGIVFCLLFFVPQIAAAQTITKEKIMDLVNIERIAQNLPLLIHNDQLSLAALLRAEDMIGNNYFSHQSPDGLMPWDFARQAGYNYHQLGENLAMDWPTAEEAVIAWMDSASHRRNILSSKYRDTGISIKYNGKHYVLVQLFGAVADHETLPSINSSAVNQLINSPPAAGLLKKQNSAKTPISKLNRDSNQRALLPPIISDYAGSENMSVLGSTYSGWSSSVQNSTQDAGIRSIFLLILTVSFFPIAIALVINPAKSRLPAELEESACPAPLPADSLCDSKQSGLTGNSKLNSLNSPK